MNTKTAYVEKYYLNNYGHGKADEEVKTVGLFVAEHAKGRVLDCGCGPVPQLYAIFMPQMDELHAIDFPQESINFVKEKLDDVKAWHTQFSDYQKTIEDKYGPQPKEYILEQVAKLKTLQQADMSVTLPFPNSYFDTVISFYSLGCLNNESELIKALQNIKRVLKPGGTLLHVNTNGKNSNDDLPAYTWRGLDQSSGLIQKHIQGAGLTLVFEKQASLSPDNNQMYAYSQISLLKAVKAE